MTCVTWTDDEREESKSFRRNDKKTSYAYLLHRLYSFQSIYLLLLFIPPTWRSSETS